MKKHILSVFGMIAAFTMSATQYMHINLPDGKEYDVKVEKTDHVSHVTEGEEVFIKVNRTDGSSSLYPMNGAEVTFDEEITRMEGDIDNWGIVKTMIEGCEYDTTPEHKVKEARKSGIYDDEIEFELYHAQRDYENCIYKKRDEIKTDFTESEVEIQNSANKFAAKLFTEISKDDIHKDQNLIFSPTSLQFALAMLANGADDDNVYTELTTALGKKDMPLDDLNEMYEKRMNNLLLSDPLKIKIGVTNAAFLKKEIHFGKNFLQNINKYYKAAANNVDFENDSTYTKINDWADKSTNGMIKDLGITKDPSLIAVLASALSFQSEWEEKFMAEMTEPGKFVTSKGEEKQVDKMNKVFRGGYAEGENYQLVTISFYEGFEMNVILPSEGSSPEKVLAEIDFDNIKHKIHENIMDGVIYCPKLSLPKFNVDSKTNLNESLKKIGLDETFDSYFNNIAKHAKINNVKQLAHLEIDEEGAKGAAVTTAELAGDAGYIAEFVDVDVNRPFIVTINNPKTHEVLFIGLINDPTLN